MSREMELVERGVTALEQIAERLTALEQSTHFVAIGMAKIVERCFCGDLLEQHPAGPCENTECSLSCKGFLPIHLAIARIHNAFATDFKSFTERVAALIPPTDGAGGIISPFNTH